MDSITLKTLAQQREAAKVRFAAEVEEKRKNLGLSQQAAQMALMHLCGAPSWEALKRVAADHAELQQQLASSPILLRQQAEEILHRSSVQEFTAWARVRSQELEALALDEYAWSFRDSEHELRFVIAQCEFSLKQMGISNSQLMATLTSAVRELNNMYQFSSQRQTLPESTKQIIFEGDNELVD